MIDKIFIDTSFIIALVNERDQYHKVAISFADQYSSQLLVVTDGILLEVANALSRRYKLEAIQIIEYFTSAEDVEVVHTTVNLFNQAFELYKIHADKTWGLVDCLSFSVMRIKNIDTALTFDRHFLQAGFHILPANKKYD